MTRKTSEVIALAVKSRYMVTDNARFYFMCNCVEYMYEQGEITHFECMNTLRVIDNTLNGEGTLYGHLLCNFHNKAAAKLATTNKPKLPNDIRLQFWAVLCFDLVRKGQ